MSDFFREMLPSEPRTMDEIRDSLDQYSQDELDFFALLREHHADLQDSIAILTSGDVDDEEKHAHLFRFFRLLEMHGKAEQETLYVNLKASVEKDARMEGYAGQDEHDLAFQLEAELEALGYDLSWSEEIAAKVKVVANLVRSHIEQEEAKMFAIAQKALSPVHLRSMTRDYLIKCRMYLDESNQPVSSFGLRADTPILNARGDVIRS